MAEHEYMEERIDTLRHLAPDSLYDTRTREEINLCVDRLRELILLGSELLQLMAPAEGDADFDSLRVWLRQDLNRQRQLLADFSDQGFPGSSPSIKH